MCIYEDVKCAWNICKCIKMLYNYFLIKCIIKKLVLRKIIKNFRINRLIYVVSSHANENWKLSINKVVDWKEPTVSCNYTTQHVLDNLTYIVCGKLRFVLKSN